MQTDCRGLELTTTSAEAVRHFDNTINAYLHFDRNTGEHLKQALRADPGFSLAYCLKGYFLQMFINPALSKKAQSALEAARREPNLTPRERLHTNALAAWIAADKATAVVSLEQILLSHPRDLLALKIAHFLHFYNGDAMQMRDSVARVLDAWEPAVPGYANVLAMLSFSLEECGAGTEAERAGRKAVALDPDPWAIHAVAHVLEMQDRRHDGVDWLLEQQPHWVDCNNFAYHLWWHLALHRLDLGQYDAVLGLYDQCIREHQSDDYLDISNAASLLWRLDEHAIDVGDRWIELGQRCAERVNDHLLLFADVHYALAIAAIGNQSERGLQQPMSTVSTVIDATQARLVGDTGGALCAAVTAWYDGNYGGVINELLPMRYRIVGIGGSHAQRDLFSQLLIAAAVRGGRHRLARALLSERKLMRPNNVWTWKRYAEVLSALGDIDGAAAADQQVHSLLAV